MRKTVERFIAWRYLRASQKDGFTAVIAWFSFLGILLGVATLIIVMSVMNGFRHELMNRILGFNGHLTVYMENVQGQNDESIRDTLKALPTVTLVSPILDKQGLCLSSAGASGALIRGIPYLDLKERPLIAKNIIQGSLAQMEHPNTVIMGHKLARKLGVLPGSSLKVMSPEGHPTPFGMLPKTRHFTVGGVFDSGMHEYDSSFMFMSLKTAQDFFSPPPSKTFELFVKNPERIKDLKELIISKFPHATIYDWQSANNHFFNAIEVQRNVMFLILTLIILVAVFNIISCLAMLVKDKTKDIAILRTLGATRKMIMKIFFLTGSFIGLGGTVLGTLVGLGFSYNIENIRQMLERLSGTQLFQAEIYFLSKLPSKVDLYEVAMVVVVSLVLSFLATAYPSWKAARLNPVEGLRYE